MEVIEAGDLVRMKPEALVYASKTKQWRDTGAIGQVVYRDDWRKTALVRFADRESGEKHDEPGHTCFALSLDCWELVDIEAMSSGKPYDVLAEQDIDQLFNWYGSQVTHPEDDE